MKKMTSIPLKLVNTGSRTLIPQSIIFRKNNFPSCTFNLLNNNWNFVNRPTNNKALSSQSIAHQKSSSKNSFRNYWLSAALTCGLGFLWWEKKTVRCQEIKTSDEKWKGLTIKLYQYQTCPFCSKTRYFLQAFKIPFEMIEVHPIFKKEVKFAESKKVPIVVIEQDGKSLMLQDSSYIISVLSSYMINEKKSLEELSNLYPKASLIDEDGKSRDEILNKHWLIHEEDYKQVSGDQIDPRREEAKWRKWADDHLVHIISPNVYRSLGEAYQAFDHHVKQGRFNGTWEGVVAKYGGAAAMWMISKKLKKKYELSDNVRFDLYRACNEWIDAIGPDRKFMGGDKPNLADISVFGVLSVMEGLDSFRDLVNYSKIKRWYFNTKRAIEEGEPQSLIV